MPQWGLGEHPQHPASSTLVLPQQNIYTDTWSGTNSLYVASGLLRAGFAGKWMLLLTLKKIGLSKFFGFWVEIVAIIYGSHSAIMRGPLLERGTGSDRLRAHLPPPAQVSLSLHPLLPPGP